MSRMLRHTYAIVFPHDEALAGRHDPRKSGVYSQLLDAGCVFQNRHGMERPGWFINNDAQINVKPYDYYGAYKEGAWRLAPDHPNVPANENDRYLSHIEGELTFDIPESFEAVKDECHAARNGVAIFDQVSDVICLSIHFYMCMLFSSEKLMGEIY